MGSKIFTILGLFFFISHAAQAEEIIYPAEIRLALDHISGSLEEISALKKIIGERPPKIFFKMAKQETTEPFSVKQVMKVLSGNENTLDLIRDIYDLSGYQVYFSQSMNSTGEDFLWTHDELKLIFTVLQLLPKQFLHLSTVDGLYRGNYYLDEKQTTILAYAKSRFFFPISERIAGALVMVRPRDNNGFGFYTNGLVLNENQMYAYTFVHELAHHFDYSYFDNFAYYKTGFYKCAWSYSFPKFWELKRTNVLDDFVSEYAKTNVMEDFAESVAYYLLFPNVLKERSLPRYSLLKEEVFLGQEF